MSDDINLIKTALNPELVKKIYDDGLSPAVKEASKIPVELIKVARLVLAPIQLLGALQDRFEIIVKKISQRVDLKQIMPVEPNIAGPILENLRYLPDDNIITECFINLLCRAIDKNRKSEAHPGFIKVLENLSPDEALLLYIISKRELKIVDKMDFDKENNMFINRVVEKSDVPTQELQYPDNFEVYYTHLDALGLVTCPIYKEDPINKGEIQVGTRRFSKLMLTNFGTFFVKACIPDDKYVKEKISKINAKG